MLNPHVLATKGAVSLVTIGSLTFVGAAAAVAAPANGTQLVSHSRTAAQQRTCYLLHRHQVQAVRNQARFDATTARFGAMAAKAQ